MLRVLNGTVQGIILTFIPLVPPVISVTHSEEELDVDIEKETQKEEELEPRCHGDKETTTSAEQTKKEVRCFGASEYSQRGSARRGMKTEMCQQIFASVIVFTPPYCMKGKQLAVVV